MGICVRVEMSVCVHLGCFCGSVDQTELVSKVVLSIGESMLITVLGRRNRDQTKLLKFNINQCGDTVIQNTQVSNNSVANEYCTVCV